MSVVSCISTEKASHKQISLLVTVGDFQATVIFYNRKSDVKQTFYREIRNKEEI